MALTAKEKAATAAYVKYFGTQPTADQLATYSSMSTSAMNKALDASAKAAAGSNSTYVDTLFNNLFGRDATAAEQTKYVAILEKGKTLNVTSIANSAPKADKAAYTNKVAVATVAASIGITVDLTKITKDALVDTKALASSYVDSVFTDLFGRPATDAEVTKYAKLLASGKDLDVAKIVKSAKAADKAAYDAVVTANDGVAPTAESIKTAAANDAQAEVTTQVAALPENTAITPPVVVDPVVPEPTPEPTPEPAPAPVTPTVSGTATNLAANSAALVTAAGANAIVTITDTGSVAATVLSAIGGATTGTVTGSGISTVTGSSTEVTAALVTAATKVTVAANAAVTLSDAGSVAATVLSALNTATTGLITAAGITTITGTVAEVKAVTDAVAATGDKINIGTMSVDVSDVAVTISSATAAAADMAAIDAKTSGLITAASLTTVTGTATEVDTFATAENTGTAIAAITNYAATVSGTDMTLTQANSIDAKNGNGIITGTVVATTAVSDLVQLTATGAVNAYTIAIAAGDATSAAADINTINGITSVAVNAAAVTTLTGAASVIQTAYDANTAGTITGLGNEALTVSDTGSVAATVLSALNTATTGLITAAGITTITGTVAEVKAVTDAVAATGDKINIGTMSVDVSDVAVTISSATAAAADMAAIDAKTSGLITAASLTTVTGTATEVDTFATAEEAGTDIAAIIDYAATVSGTDMTLTQANSIDAKNGNGIITGTVVATTAVSDLVQLTATGAVNAYTIAIAASDATSSAANLNTIDGITSVAVNATAVTTISLSSYDAINTLIAADNAGTIDLSAVTSVSYNNTFGQANFVTWDTDMVTTFATSVSTAEWTFDDVSDTIYHSAGDGTAQATIVLAGLGDITTVTGVPA